MSCYCAATPKPPCGWCEKGFQCDLCGKIKNQDDDSMIQVDQFIACNSCVEEAGEKSALNHGPYECVCPIVELMNIGCKCGGS